MWMCNIVCVDVYNLCINMWAAYTNITHYVAYGCEAPLQLCSATCVSLFLCVCVCVWRGEGLFVQFVCYPIALVHNG